MAQGEFETLFVRELGLLKESGAAVFAFLDKDADGAVSLADFKAGTRAYATAQASAAAAARKKEAAAELEERREQQISVKTTAAKKRL